ncbi:MAG: outer membrane beta-barrel protein [Gemmatimonadota bacterium]|nr:outer membrane beta-barrel protein [Gemmatimonadota bacterium]
MTTRLQVTLATLAVLVASLTIAPAARAQTPVRFSVVGGLSLPIGDLGNGADLGLNLGLRGEGRPLAPNWAFRGDVSYDRYAGHGAVNQYSYLAFAANLVHHEAARGMYEFGGLGVYNSRVTFSNALDRSDTNLGMQMGLGFELTSDKRVFTEFGLTSAFTSGRSSLWFPLRVGLRF